MAQIQELKRDHCVDQYTVYTLPSLKSKVKSYPYKSLVSVLDGVPVLLAALVTIHAMVLTTGLKVIGDVSVAETLEC